MESSIRHISKLSQTPQLLRLYMLARFSQCSDWAHADKAPKPSGPVGRLFSLPVKCWPSHLPGCGGFAAAPVKAAAVTAIHLFQHLVAFSSKPTNFSFVSM